MERQFTFLQAANGRYLTKTFRADGTVEPYPLVKDFTSTVFVTEHFGEFVQAVQDVAAMGGCLLKGPLLKDLDGESRQNQHNTHADTSFLVLDYDANDGFDSVDEFLIALDPGLAQVSYLFQYSASAGIKQHTKVRGHTFIWLDKPVNPQQVKEWTRKLNLTVPQLRSRVRLSRSGMTLCYPLDITVNQNDKLIYIAPPRCEGFEDPIQNRFIVVRRQRDTFNFNPTVAANRNRSDETKLMHELQDEQGLPRFKAQLKYFKGQEVTTNPRIGQVTGIKEGETYTRINLNGGDSWAYWHWSKFDENEDIFLYSFKDDSIYFLKDICPAYYEQLVNERRARRAVRDYRPIVFRDKYSDRYFTALIDREAGEVTEVHEVSSKDKCRDFMAMHGERKPQTIDTWRVVFDPTTAGSADVANRTLNTFRPTPYMLESGRAAGSWPTIDKVLRSICVDQPTFLHFINWLAYIFQTRRKTGTAWIFQGTTGTGKGVLYAQILAPLLGHSYTREVRIDQFEDAYNGWLDEKILVMMDEGDINSSAVGKRILNLLKNLITEPFVAIRHMRAAAKEVQSFHNFLVATNELQGIRVFENDRRYNVAPRQEVPIDLTTDFDLIAGELPAFAAYLAAFSVNAVAVRTPLMNKARRELIDHGITNTERLARAVAQGNLDVLWEFYWDECSNAEYLLEMPQFKVRLNEWTADAIAGKVSAVQMDDLINLHMMGRSDDRKKRISAQAYTRWARPLGIRFDPIRKRVKAGTGTKLVTVTHIPFKVSPEWVDDGTEKTDNVVDLAQSRRSGHENP